VPRPSGKTPFFGPTGFESSPFPGICPPPHPPPAPPRRPPGRFFSQRNRPPPPLNDARPPFSGPPPETPRPGKWKAPGVRRTERNPTSGFFESSRKKKKKPYGKTGRALCPDPSSVCRMATHTRPRFVLRLVLADDLPDPRAPTRRKTPAREPAPVMIRSPRPICSAQPVPPNNFPAPVPSNQLVFGFFVFFCCFFVIFGLFFLCVCFLLVF